MKRNISPILLGTERQNSPSTKAVLTIGSVPYLNAKPLVYGLDEEIHWSSPLTLARELRAGEVDIALVPVVECLENPVYKLVDQIGIAAYGQVYSVILSHRVPLAKIKTVALDAASKTSTQLTRILLDKFLGLKIEYLPQESAADADLWIGDQAIARRRNFPGEMFWDLGQAWQEATGLPFVFAVWAMRPDDRNLETAEQLRAVANLGLEARREIAKTPEEYQYLTRHIRYKIGLEEKAGLQKFSELLVETGLIPQAPKLEWL